MKSATVIYRIDPPMPVVVELDGECVKAMAHAWIDYGFEHNLIWLVAVDDSRQFWCVSNKHVRCQDNITMDRPPAGGPDPLGWVASRPADKDKEKLKKIYAESFGGKNEKEVLKEALNRDLGKHQLAGDTIAAQMDAAEQSDEWAPVMVGPGRRYISGYRCRKCNIVRTWPEPHHCPLK